MANTRNGMIPHCQPGGGELVDQLLLFDKLSGERWEQLIYGLAVRMYGNRADVMRYPPGRSQGGVDIEIAFTKSQVEGASHLFIQCKKREDDRRFSTSLFQEIIKTYVAGRHFRTHPDASFIIAISGRRLDDTRELEREFRRVPFKIWDQRRVQQELICHAPELIGYFFSADVEEELCGSRYGAVLRAAVARSERLCDVRSRFVRLQVSPLQDDCISDAVASLCERVTQANATATLLIGEGGSGKSTILDQLEQTLAQKPEKDVERPLPLRVSLAHPGAGQAAASVVATRLSDSLSRAIGQRAQVSSSWVELSRVGPVVLMIEDVELFLSESGNLQTFLKELLEARGDQDVRLIGTCRTEVFRRDAERYLPHPWTAYRVLPLATEPASGRTTVRGFTRECWPEAWERMKQILDGAEREDRSGLQELLRRPLFLKLVATFLVDSSISIQLPELYPDTYLLSKVVEEWIETEHVRDNVPGCDDDLEVFAAWMALILETEGDGGGITSFRGLRGVGRDSLSRFENEAKRRAPSWNKLAAAPMFRLADHTLGFEHELWHDFFVALALVRDMRDQPVAPGNRPLSDRDGRWFRRNVLQQAAGMVRDGDLEQLIAKVRNPLDENNEYELGFYSQCLTRAPVSPGQRSEWDAATLGALQPLWENHREPSVLRHWLAWNIPLIRTSDPFPRSVVREHLEGLRNDPRRRAFHRKRIGIYWGAEDDQVAESCRRTIREICAGHSRHALKLPYYVFWLGETGSDDEDIELLKRIASVEKTADDALRRAQERRPVAL